MYTRCPNCQTYFKISADHLKKAGGKVRCGQCMKVFNSLGNLLEQLPVSMAERSRPANAPPRAPTPAAPPPPAAKPAPPPRPAPAAAPPPRPAPPPPKPEPPPATKAAPVRETPREAPVEIPPTREPPAKVEARPPPEEPVFMVEDEPPPEDAGPTLDLTRDDQIQNLDVGPTSNVRDLVPYPGEITGAEARLFNQPLWGAGVGVLLVVFILQYAYFMRDDLARYTELRPWLQSYCDLLGCDLPLQQNVDLIKLTHRDITVHPRVKGALLINAVFVNNADYLQPFPLMQITLSDIGGRVIARRRFQPSEYLDANVNLRRGMPPADPIQIVLEIADPGKDAVNFEFNFFYQHS